MREASLAQFPAGTRFALLRQMLLLDDRGEVVATHLTASIQMPVHKTIRPTRSYPFEYSSHQEDWRAYPVLSRCSSCHEASGIYAVGSYANKLIRVEIGPVDTPGLFEGNPDELTQGAIESDRLTRNDLGVLQGMWRR